MDTVLCSRNALTPNHPLHRDSVGQWVGAQPRHHLSKTPWVILMFQEAILVYRNQTYFSPCPGEGQHGQLFIPLLSKSVESGCFLFHDHHVPSTSPWECLLLTTQARDSLLLLLITSVVLIPPCSHLCPTLFFSRSCGFSFTP